MAAHQLCVVSVTDSKQTPWAGIGFSGKLLVCGTSCCFELTG